MPTAVSPSALLARIEADLRGNILPFWLKHAVDRTRRTFHGAVDNDLKVDPSADRGALLTSRILWTYAAAFRHYGDPAYRDMADLAHHDLMTRHYDAKHGGYYWSIKADGTVQRDRKQIYGQAFAIYALSEYHAATGARAPLDQAIALFGLVERHARDRTLGGYIEAFSRDWSPIDDLRLGGGEPNVPKTQNTMLHVMEAYTRLLEVWPDAGLRQALHDLVGVMLTRIVNPRTMHLGLFFTNDWKPTSDQISYGHDIEAAWLLSRSADVLGDPELAVSVRTAAIRIADVTLAEGIDAEGAVVNLGDPTGILDASRDWWPQAEAVVGFINAFQLSGDRRYLVAAARAWDFIEAHLIDRKNGEWFRGVSRDGRVTGSPEKVGFWKCPYHNGRMGLEAIARLRTLKE